MKDFKEKKGGFSLAEMMIVMLLVAVVLAATTPMITKRVSRERSDKVFDMLNSDTNNAVEYIKGRKQRIFMNAKSDGYVGIREPGETIPKNSVMFGYNKYGNNADTQFVALGFGTSNKLNSVAIGYQALAGYNAVAIGSKTNANNNSGMYSVSIGYSATAKKPENVVIGGNTSSAGEKSVVLGYQASSSGDKGTALGYNATAVSNSTAIGHDAKANITNTIVLGTDKDTVYIPGNLVVDHATLVGRAGGDADDFYFYSKSSEDGRHFAINSANDWKGAADIYMVRSSTGDSKNKFGAKVGPYSTAWTSDKDDFNDNHKTNIDFSKNAIYSDIRLKDIGEDFTGGLEELNKLNFFHFTFKDDKDKTPQVGIIAQDLKKVFPTAVKADEKGFLQIRWDEMFYSVINAVKELNAKITAIAEKVNIHQKLLDSQAQTIEHQQTQIKELSARIEKLETKIK